MEPLTWTELAATSLVALILLRLVSSVFRPRKLNLPPGPKPWPVIGNFNLIGPLPHRSLHTLSKTYGPLMMLRLGSYRVLVASSVDTARFILKTQDINFASRPKTASGKYTTYNYSNVTWSPCGPYWRQARKLFLVELFSSRRLEASEYIRVEETRRLLKSLFDATNLTEKPILIKDLLSTLSFNVISRMVLGKRYLDEEEEGHIVSPDEFKRMMDELFLLNGVFNIGDWIPYLGFLDLQGYVKRMKAVANNFDRFLEHVLDEHNQRRKSVEGWTPKDMVDVLLEFADHPNLEVKLERHGVKAFTLDLIAGGTESSTVILEWAMSELLRRPDVIKKATVELDAIVGRERWVEEKDIPNLPFIRAIIKETMRLHPVVPMLVPRVASVDVQISGYNVPKGTRVLVNTWTIQRDPAVYDNPEEFWPDRFISGPKKDIDVKGQDFELLPFGSGRRMCPGYSLGLKVIESNLANLLHGFAWKLPEGVCPKDLNMEEIFGLTNPRKTQLVVYAQPCLAPHLYNM